MSLKLALVSDLHLDCDPQADREWLDGFKNDEEADILVVAGDVFTGFRPSNMKAFFEKTTDMYRDVLFVPGNHEYWSSSPCEVDDFLEEMSVVIDNFTCFVRPGSVEIQGQHFFGGTLWYPKPSPGKPQHFIDFDQIHFRKKWIFRQNLLFRRGFERDVGKNTVVVSHHLPTPHSTPLQFRGSSHDHYFMSNIQDLILDKSPKLYAHGHTHEPCDYTIGNYGYQTRVVCNPRGYPSEIATRGPYKPLIVEV